MRILKLLTRCSLEQSALNAIVVDFSLLLAPSRCPLSNCWVCRRVSIVHVAFDAVSPKTRPATCLLLLQAQLLVPVILLHYSVCSMCISFYHPKGLLS